MVVIVVPVTVLVVIAVTAAAAYLFQLLTAFVRLPAAFAMTLDCLVQLLFGLMNASLAALVGFVGARRQGSPHQTNDRQQGNRKHLLGIGHRYHLCQS